MSFNKKISDLIFDINKEWVLKKQFQIWSFLEALNNKQP